jgi:hypothetical protein
MVGCVVLLIVFIRIAITSTLVHIAVISNGR